MAIIHHSWFHRYWWLVSIGVAIGVGIAAKIMINRFNRSEFDYLYGQQNVSAGMVEGLKVIDHLEKNKFDANDEAELLRLSVSPEARTRMRAFDAIAYMATKGNRSQALELLKRVDSDPSNDIRKRKIWWHFVARADDWRVLATKGLESQDANVRSDAKLALENDPMLKK